VKTVLVKVPSWQRGKNYLPGVGFLEVTSVGFLEEAQSLLGSEEWVKLIR
jgi:hypothetical protein